MLPYAVLPLLGALFKTALPSNVTIYPTLGDASPPRYQVFDAGLTSLELTNAHHGTFLLDTRDMIDEVLSKFGEWDEEVVEVLKAVVGPSDVVLEAGTNIGPYTVLLSRLVGSTGAVVAVEPQQYVISRLHANLVLNGATHNVIVHQAALGTSHDRFIRMSMPKPQHVNLLGGPLTAKQQQSLQAKVQEANLMKDGCTSSLTTALCRENNAMATFEVLVRLTTVDKLGLPWCNFMKIDAEGGEMNVLKGAELTINRTRPLVYMEEHNNPSRSDAIAFLTRLNYNVYVHRYHTLISRSPKAGSPGSYRETNALGVPKERLKETFKMLPQHLAESFRAAQASTEPKPRIRSFVT